MAYNYLDKTGLALVWEKVKNALTGKVDKVDGKGLSTNDYTSDEKTKLAGVASGAQVNVLEGIQKNGTNVTITNKIANITVPTQVSDLTNDSGYITQSAIQELDSSIAATTNQAISAVTITDGKITASSKVTVPTNNNQLTNGAGYQTASDVSTAIASALENVTGIDFEIVQSLPQTGEAGVIYLIAHAHGTGDSYDEYIYVNNAFEKIGNTDIDLSGYVEDTDMTAITSTEINTICV